MQKEVRVQPMKRYNILASYIDLEGGRAKIQKKQTLNYLWLNKAADFTHGLNYFAIWLRLRNLTHTITVLTIPYPIVGARNQTDALGL